MDLSLSSETEHAEDRSWLGNARHDQMDWVSGTLDLSAFTGAQHFPDSYLLSGIVLGQLTASPFLYAPYDDTDVDGSEIAQGLLYTSQNLPAGATTAPDPTAPVMIRGSIRSTKLPGAGGWAGGGDWDQAAANDLVGRIVDLDSPEHTLT